MAESRALVLGPLDVAALWPQLGRLDTELISSRRGRVLFQSTLAATGLGRLPPLPNVVMLGVRHSLRYRGILAARPSPDGGAWEIIALRLASPGDETSTLVLLDGCVRTAIDRRARLLFARFEDNGELETIFRRAGLAAFGRDLLFRIPPAGAPADRNALDRARAADAHAIFRHYCRTVPERVRRHEAPTGDDFAAYRDMLDFTSEFVLRDDGGGICLWLGIRDAECRLFAGDGDIDAALALIEHESRPGSRLVIPDHAEALLEQVIERGYVHEATRVAASRRLAPLIPLSEPVAVPAAGSYPVPR